MKIFESICVITATLSDRWIVGNGEPVAHGTGPSLDRNNDTIRIGTYLVLAILQSD